MICITTLVAAPPQIPPNLLFAPTENNSLAQKIRNILTCLLTSAFIADRITFSVYRLIETVGDNMSQIQDNLKRKSHNEERVEMVPVNVASKINDLHRGSSDEQTSFSDSRMAVLMMCLDSATTESGNNCSLVEAIRAVAPSITGEIIIVEESWNSVVVVLGPNISPSTASDVLLLEKLAIQVIGTVSTRKIVEVFVIKFYNT